MDEDLHAKSLAHALRALIPYKQHIRAVYLFGSCARGEQTATSDVNLFLFVTPDTPPKLMRKIRVALMPDEINLPEVVVFFSNDDEFTGSRIFNENLKREAKLLWSRDSQ